MIKKDGRLEAGITLIATNCELVGDIHFSDQLMVNGVVKGNIYAEAGSRATLTVSEKGQVHGEIRVPNVIVNGKVVGKIRSDKHIELAARAEVHGNVYYNLIEMVKGSKVEGQFLHVQDGAGSAESKPAKAAEKPEDESKVAAVAAVK
jgi:cytoskeletal protein CcmA (bactofilin family)